MNAGRDIVDAARRVTSMSDKEIKAFARHDPDVFRDIARYVVAAVTAAAGIVIECGYCDRAHRADDPKCERREATTTATSSPESGT